MCHNNRLEILQSKWKPYWFGSPKAVIAFIGSSPGNSGAEIPIELPRADKLSNHFATFSDNRGFWNTLREYSKFMLDGHYEMGSMDWLHHVMAGNLIEDHAGASAKILHKLNRSNAVEDAIDILQLVKPKLIICLESAVQKILLNGFKTKGFSVSNSSIELVESKIKKPLAYKVETFSLMSDDWKFNLTKTPMHPSRRSFCDQENIKDFLRQQLLKTK